LSEIVGKYTEEIWYEKFLELLKKSSLSENPLGKGAKIVLVSDFINKIGGIETYLHDVKALLEEQGHKVRLRGGYLPRGIFGRLRIRFGLLTFPFNFRSAWKFKTFLKKEKPDLIWFHSLVRNLGPRVVRVATKEGTQKNIRMMYHDLGYFYPFPKKLFFIDQIQTPLSFQHFLAGAKGE
jgi:hypothetical protein